MPARHDIPPEPWLKRHRPRRNVGELGVGIGALLPAADHERPRHAVRRGQAVLQLPLACITPLVLDGGGLLGSGGALGRDVAGSLPSCCADLQACKKPKWRACVLKGRIGQAECLPETIEAECRGLALCALEKACRPDCFPG